MGFQVGIKYSTPAPFPQVGIKQAYVPAVSSTHLAYKSCSDCLRARARLTICGPQLDCLLNVTVPTWSYHVRPLVTVWGNPCSLSINNRGSYLGIKYSTPAPFPQIGIKQAYVPAVSSTHLAYKSCSDCLRARARLTICGPQLDCLLNVTVPTWSYHVRPLVTVWGNPCSLSINNRGSYRNSHRFLTIPQVGIKHFKQVAIKLDSNFTPAPFPQIGIKQAYVPAVSSTHLAYKSCSDCLRARARLTICGPQLDCLLNVTVPTWSYHVRPLVTVWGNPCSLSINNRGSYRNSHRFLTIPQVGIKHFKQVAIKLDSNFTPAPFPQIGIKQAYVPAVSSTHLAYKSCSDCLRARARLTICGPQLDCLLNVTVPTWSYHVRPLVTVWGNPCSLSINNRGSYRNSHRFLTIPQVGIKHFKQVAIKLDSNFTPAPFPQVGIKQAYVPAVSSTHLAYKSCSDCLRARARLTICGPQLDCLLNVTVPTWSYHVRPLVTVWGNPCSLSINNRGSYHCHVPYPNGEGASERAHLTKADKYKPIVEYYEREGYKAEYRSMVVSALGNIPRSSSGGGAWVRLDRSGFRRIIPSSCTDVIKGSRNAYVEHITGQ
ncbi:hypothetical protein PRIPAC_80594, partial [Pristionchus pacificus]|uniref:Uncharacterized protein n=1 Tax=Pristionchus pacificus TaxID=54126 RepID=A0A2A6CQK5_PRIPA